MAMVNLFLKGSYYEIYLQSMKRTIAVERKDQTVI